MSASPSFSARTTGVRPFAAQRLARGEALAAAVAHVTLAHQRERHVGQRREVARTPEGTELVDDRRDARVEERGVRVGGRDPNARDAATEVGQSRHHHRANDLGLDLGTDARGVAANQ